MGLFSSKASTSSETNVTTRNVAAGDDGLVANEGGQINILDAGAIEFGFDFAGEVSRSAFDATESAFDASFDAARYATENAFDFSDDASIRAMEFSRESENLFYDAVQFLTDKSAAQSSAVLDTATDAIERTVTVQTTTADERLQKVMMIFVVAGVAVAALFMLRGKKNGS